MLASLSRFSFTAVLLLSFAGTRSDAKSVIVDDADTTNITYSSGWNIGNNCTRCFAKPSKPQAFDETWHDGTARGSADLSFEFTFTGTSVEARYIAIDIINTSATFTTGTNISYLIDGVRSGTFLRNPADEDAYVYNQTLLSVKGLSNSEHTLRVGLLKPSVLLLDYLVYDDGSDVTAPPSTNIGAIIGGVVAGVIVVGLGVGLVWYLKNRRSRETSRRARRSILRSNNDAPPPPSMAETTQTGENFNPEQPASSHTTNYISSVTGSNPPGETLLRTNPLPTIPRSSLVVTNPSNLPSVPEAHQLRNVSEKPPAGVLPRHSGQGVTTSSAPPSSFYTNAVANRVEAEIPDEPVEAGVMSRQASTRTVPPPYSPGGFQHDEDAPSLPEQTYPTS